MGKPLTLDDFADQWRSENGHRCTCFISAPCPIRSGITDEMEEDYEKYLEKFKEDN